MKTSKKMIMITSFITGLIILIISATADIVSKTGYDNLKDSLKITASKASTSYANFTLKGDVVVRLNDTKIISSNNITRYDSRSNSLLEETFNNFPNNEEQYLLNYRDEEQRINYSSDNDVYTVYKTNRNASVINPIQNSFEHSSSEDIERIIDALLGNLKNYVIAEKNSDGTKTIYASIKDYQIPPLANAIASFIAKETTSQRIFFSQTNIPTLAKNIYLGDVYLRLLINEDSTISNLTFSGALVGNDEDGNNHVLSLEFNGELTNINKTIVEIPDLTDKEVNVIENHKTPRPTQEDNFENYLGLYKNDIIILSENGFEKIGERFLEINEISDNKLVASYFEEYIDSKKDKAIYPIESFTFETDFQPRNRASRFTPNQNDVNLSGSINIDPIAPRIYLYIDSHDNSLDIVNRESFDNTFIKVLD